ncbi:heavy-metal-associated domain-containing protein [Bacillus alkalicellulosilyticus]|uniref:heavy-metal-associated domain-containing protein n=1 Tax=Alkalihalobacterium alkalicellulosilyticum TaxID=1912214 RepID=UPI000996ACE7|nr:cation transporter [Bacillus alkalicellulosilyticus]
MKNITLQVERMSCGHCINTVERALEGVQGVMQAKGDLAHNTVDVVYQESETDVSHMRKAVEDAGYWIV